MELKYRLIFLRNTKIQNLLLILFLINNISIFICLDKDQQKKASLVSQENLILENSFLTTLQKNKNLHFLQTTTNNSNPADTNTSIIKIDTFTLIMIVIGSVVFITGIVIIIVCCCKKKQTDKQNKMQEDQVSDSKRAAELKNSSDIKEKNKAFPKEKEEANVNKEYLQKENDKKDFDNKNYKSEKQSKYIDESEIIANVNKHMDKSATDRRFLDSTDRNIQGI
jgi:hypothetical protein